MPFLYNCKHSGDQYSITKFDAHMNVESTYLCTLEECNCPAGQRPTCRHREMLPKFITRGAIGTEWMFDFDRGGWVQTNLGDPPAEREPKGLVTPPLPAGVQMLSLDDPAELHNAIAEAVGEAPRPLAVFIRRRR